MRERFWTIYRALGFALVVFTWATLWAVSL